MWLHLAGQQDACRGRDADVRVFGWAEGEHPGCCRSAGIPGHQGLGLLGLVVAGVAVGQVQHGGGVVTDGCGPELDQGMGEHQGGAHTHGPARQSEIPDETKGLSVSQWLRPYNDNHLNI